MKHLVKQVLKRGDQVLDLYLVSVAVLGTVYVFLRSVLRGGVV